MLEFLRRLQFFVNRRRVERELAEEMEAHREMAAQHGNHFGNSLRLREEARDAWGLTDQRKICTTLPACYENRQDLRAPRCLHSRWALA